jgi:hypothetical protein
MKCQPTNYRYLRLTREFQNGDLDVEFDLLIRRDHLTYLPKQEMHDCEMTKYCSIYYRTTSDT